MTVTTSIKNSFTKLPPAVQVIVALLLGLVVYIILKRIVAAVKGFGNKLSIGAEISAFENEGMQVTYLASQYKVFAEQIFQAVDGNGTDTDAVVDVFEEMENDLDVLHLESAYIDVETNSDFTSLGQRLQYESKGWWGWSIGDDSTVIDVNATLASKGILRRY